MAALPAGAARARRSCRRSGPWCSSAPIRVPGALRLRRGDDHGPQARPRRASTPSGGASSPTTRSTSSSRPAPPARPRAPRSPTATSSTTPSPRPAPCGSRPARRSASRCRSTTASAWSSASCAATAYGVAMVFPGEGFDAGDTLAAIDARTLHRRPRRAHDVPGDARPPGLRPLRHLLACAPASWRAPPAPSR